ncbi:short chain dehydrogenase reductase family protein [Cystoisospora suis]|uniref:Short chain dehydrogenase reductase family protein n=1 Tax=Cystoisospora suis TaxID=483139 RepID=A0A2C6L9S4_9APIC|nr:short chain dehydrogenase reductase family protein [Cystoisospora suis]
MGANGREKLIFYSAMQDLCGCTGVACRGVMLPSSVDTEIIEVNLTSQMAFVKLVVARMIQQQAGHVIFTNSMSARITLGGRTAYSAAKGALLNFAYGLTRELRAMGSPVQVTSVLPGYIRTDLCDRELYADGSVIPKGSHVAEDIRQGLSSDRTAELMLRGSSRGLSEIWIGKNPDLFYMYSAYYYPGVTNLLVNYGAASYARSIEQEIRERRNAARRAAAAGAADKSPAVDRLGSFKKRKAERSAAAEEDVAAAKEAPEKATVEPAAADKPPALPSAQDAVDTVAGVISDAVTQLTKLASFGSDSTKDEEDSLRKERRNHDDQPVKGSVTEGTRTTRTVPPPQPVPPVHDGRRAEL